MKYLHRFAEAKLQELMRYFPVVAVLGARQVGKSTLVQNLFGDHIHTTVFDPVQDIGGARKDPDFFLQNCLVPHFFDEIQYAPELLSSIKRKVDKEKENGKFVLSGSQSLTILKDISESLAGRIAILNLMPMSVREMEERTANHLFIEEWLARKEPDFSRWATLGPQNAYRRIWRGGYPGLLPIPDHLVFDYWESYMRTYIERDVRRLAGLASLQQFGRFVGLCSSFTGQEVNSSLLGRELGVDRKTAEAWTSLLEATFQWITVPAYSRNAVKRVTGKRKGYFADTGFACYLQRISSPEAIGSHPFLGRLFETFVVTEILKTMQTLSAKPMVHHFRTYAGAEVDLIVELDGRLFPIEIKATTKPSKSDLKGFASFRECFADIQIEKNLLICSVEKPFWIDPVTFAVPWWVL